MGMSPWAQAYFAREIERSERARFRRILNRINIRLVNEMPPFYQNDIEAALDEARSKITPRKGGRS
jgi:hypothetical protein